MTSIRSDVAGGGNPPPEGTRDADRSVAVVLDADDGNRQVATLVHESLGPEGMGERLKVLGRWYNEAYLVIEKNNQGLACVDEVRRGENAYPPEKIFRMGIEVGKHGEPGWHTTVNSRNSMLTYLAHAISEGEIAFHDRRTVQEHMNFVYGSDGKAQAQRGFHDDHVFAAGLALHGCQNYPRMMDEARLDRYRTVRRQSEIRSGANSVTGY